MRKTRDPITGFKEKIIAAGLVSEAELKEIDKNAKKEVVYSFPSEKIHKFIVFSIQNYHF